jgi:hypothetical protein
MRVPVCGIVIVAPVALLMVCGFASDTTQSQGPHFDTDVIVTATPDYEPSAALRRLERFPEGAQLLLMHEGKAEPLVEGFAATSDADLSFDAQTVLFAGRRWRTIPGRYGSFGCLQYIYASGI